MSDALHKAYAAVLWLIEHQETILAAVGAFVLAIKGVILAIEAALKAVKAIASLTATKADDKVLAHLTGQLDVLEGKVEKAQAAILKASPKVAGTLQGVRDGLKPFTFGRH